MDNEVKVKITGDASGAVAAAHNMSKAMADASALTKAKLSEIQNASRAAFGALGESASGAASKIRTSTESTIRESDRASQAVTRSARTQEIETRRATESITRNHERVRAKMLELAAVVGAAFTGRELIGLMDGYTRLQNQLKLAGLEGERLESVQKQLFETSQKYGVSLESLAGLYGRTSQGSKELGASEEQMLKFTRGVSAALKIQGGSAESTSGAIMQLTQALGGSIVRAEEFNSINEGARPILQAVANGIDRFGGSVSQLRNEVIKGKVTSQEFFQAFLKGTDELETKAAKAVLTTSGGFVALNNALTVYFGEASKANGISAALGTAIGTLANNLHIVIPAIAAIAVSLSVGYVTAAVAARVATVGLGQSMLAAFGGPIGIAISAVIIAIGAYVASTKSATGATGQLGTVSASTATAIGKLNNILAQDVSAKVAGDAQSLARARVAQANATYQAASAEIALRKAQAAARLKDLEDGTVSETVSSGRGGKRTVETSYANRELTLQRGQARNAAASADSEQAALNVALANAKRQIIAPPAPTGGGATAAKAAKAPKVAKGSAGPTLADQWRTDLAEALLVEENWARDENEVALEFWQSKLKMTKAGSKKQLQVQREVARLQKTARLQAQRDEVDEIRATEQIKDEAARRDIALAELGLQQQLQIIDEREQAGELSEKRAIQMRADVHRQMFALDIEAEERTHQIKIEALKTQIAMAGLEVNAKRTLNRQLELLEAQHQGRMAILRKGAMLKERAEDNKQLSSTKQRINSISQSWAQSLARMATLQQGFGATIKSLWGAVADMITNALASIIQKYITQWLSYLLIKKATGAAERVSEVVGLSQVGAAAAFASTAAIPIVGPGLAPAAAGAAMAAIMAFAPGTSAAGGYDIPAGINPIVQTHAREMILPEKFADVIRGMADGGGSGGGVAGMNVHIHATDADSVKRLFHNNKRELANALRAAARDGVR